ncbi:MAG: hypothetical protein QM817_01250 [Archangium sp.]
MRSLLVACGAAVVLCACPSPNGMDGGTGGGITGGGTTGGGTGGGTTGGGTGGGTVTFDSFCTSYTNSICDWAVRCGLFDTRMGCDSMTGSSDPARSLCDPARASLNDMRVSFDSAAAGACLAQLSGNCAFPQACTGQFFNGLVAVDGGCYGEIDCGANAFCDSSQMMCPGKCNAATGAAGAIVQDSRACQDGLTTKSYRDGGFFGVQCVARGGLGAPCEQFSDTCDTGFICNIETHQCETPRGQNAVCSFTDGGIPNFPSLCQTFLGCRPEAATGRAICDVPGATGQGCFPGIGASCRLDLRCSIPTDGGRAGTCGPLGAIGAECASSNDCVSTAWCNRPQGTQLGSCAAPAPLGASCDGQSRSCQSGNCDFGTQSDGGFGFTCVVNDGGMTTTDCVDPTP